MRKLNQACRCSLTAVLLTFFFGGAMSGQGINPTIPPPEFSHSSGFYIDGFDLEISTQAAGDIILYTLDGSDPLPENTEGAVFNYKNRYPENPGQPFGELLTETYITNIYSESILIEDRSPMPDRLSQKSTTATFNTLYFPNAPSFKGTVVRARTWRPGEGLSEIRSHSYFVTPDGEDRYGLPVISLGLNEKHIFDYEDGIAVAGITFDNWRLENPGTQNAPRSANNFWRRGNLWEHEASLNLFWPGVSGAVLNHNLGLRLHGFSSRSFPKKSWRLYARNAYGATTFDYPVFESQEDASFKRFILFSGSGDINKAQLRDPVVQRIYAPMGVYTIDAKPAVLFINGEFRGLHAIRERYDHHYFERKQGILEENLEILSNRELTYGDQSNYDFLVDFVSARDMTDPDVYDAFTTIVDTHSFWSVFAANLFAANGDWLPNNTEMWRSKQEDNLNNTLWHFAAVDCDLAWGWAGETNHQRDMIDEVLYSNTEPGGGGFAFHGFLADMFRKAMQNERFRRGFINRSADLMNTNFLPERANAIITAYAQEMAPHMPEQIARWKIPASIGSWINELNIMGQFSELRPSSHRQHIQNGLSTGAPFELTLDVNSPEGGYIRLNTIDINEDTPGINGAPFPWSGIYFREVPVSVTAVPYPGYAFESWEGDTEASARSFSAAFDAEGAFLKANFIPIDTLTQAAEEAFHYWHFNDLSGVFETADADFSSIGGGVITYPGEGTGYMDDVNEGSEINLQYDQIPGRALRARNPSATRALIIKAPTTGHANIVMRYSARRTNNGAQQQKISYRTEDGGPWIHFDSVQVFDTHALYAYDFSAVNDANDNPEFALRITFTDPAASNPSGNNRFDNLSISGTPLFEGGIPLLPLAAADFEFDQWDENAQAGTYPDFMRFYRSEDPTAENFDEKNGASALYQCPYNKQSGPRINGLGENGFSIVSADAPQYDNCTGLPVGQGWHTGSAVIGLNTIGVNAASMTWKTTVETPGERIFAVRLQYRTGSTGRFFELTHPTTFSSEGASAGNSEIFDFMIPEFLLDRPEVHLRFLFFAPSPGSGSFPEISVDSIRIASPLASAPQLTTSSDALTDLYAEVNESGDALTYTVSGSNLNPESGSISVFAPLPFEISEDGLEFSTELELPYSEGELSRELSVRLRSDAGGGAKRDLPLIHAGGGADPVIVKLSGEVAYPVNLSPGDISIIGYRSEANDGFAFVNWVPLPAGTVIIFTDKGYDGASLLSTENTLVWQNTSNNLPPGVVIKIGGPEFGDGEDSSLGTVISGKLDGLSQNGDNIFAVQGSITDPTWIHGISYMSDWLTEGTVENSTSYLPSALNFPGGNLTVNALNAEYDGPRSGAPDYAIYINSVHDTENMRTDANGGSFGDFNLEYFTLAGDCELIGATLSSETSGSLCANTGSSQTIDVVATGGFGPNQVWVLFAGNGDIINFRFSNSLFQLDGLAPGNYGIGLLTFENNVDVSQVTNINDLPLLPGCWAASENVIDLFLRTAPEAGEVFIESEGPYCANDAIEVSVQGNSGTNSFFALTSAGGTGEVLATTQTGVFSPDDLTAGTYEIYHIALQEGASAEGIASLNQIEGCFELSQPVGITIANCIIGEFSSVPNPTKGPSMVSFTLNESSSAILEILDMQGRLVETFFEGNATAGTEYRFYRDDSGMADGIYLMRLKTPRQTAINKLILIR